MNRADFDGKASDRAALAINRPTYLARDNMPNNECCVSVYLCTGLHIVDDGGDSQNGL